jgi:predicted MPP superfamily phosphohydrolase
MRFIFFSPLIFLFYGSICTYIGLRLIVPLRFFFPNIKTVMYWLPFAVLCLAFVLVNFLPHNFHFLRVAGSFWLAFFLYMFFLFAASDIIRLILFLCKIKINNLKLYAVCASLIVCIVLIIYGAVNARSVNTVKYNISLSGNGENIRIGLVSDLHIGSSIGRTKIEKMVNAINAEKPDMVCIAGDIFDGNLDNIDDLPGIIYEFKRIDAPLGVYACLGNHDIDRLSLSGGKTEKIVQILKEADIALLQDEIYTLKDNLFIAGRKDARPIGMSVNRLTPKELCAGLDGTIIMMDHQPNKFTEIEQAGVDLLFCGHTHSGQIFPMNLITNYIAKRTGTTHYGYWRGKTMQAVVTSGIGFWGPPLRIGTKCETVIINVNFNN